MSKRSCPCFFAIFTRDRLISFVSVYGLLTIFSGRVSLGMFDDDESVEERLLATTERRS